MEDTFDTGNTFRRVRKDILKGIMRLPRGNHIGSRITIEILRILAFVCLKGALARIQMNMIGNNLWSRNMLRLIV